jgi:tetratricopeptide (TPR) repeat protein
LPVQGWFWVTFAVLWAGRKGPEPPAGNLSPPRQVFWAAAAAAALVFTARDFRSNVLLKISGDALAGSRWADARRAAELSLAGWIFWENEARAANNGSVAAYGEGNLTASEHFAGVSAELNPDMPFPWGQLGLIRARRGDMRGAREALARALSLHPRHPESLHVLGNIAVMEGDWESAERFWSAALRENPGLSGVEESLDSLRRAARRGKTR